MKFEEKNIGILGLGKSGYWSAKLAKSLENNVFVSDSNANANKIFFDDLKMLGIDVEIGNHSNQILESDLKKSMYPCLNQLLLLYCRCGKYHTVHR